MKTPRLLVIEDNPATSKTLSAILRQASYKVIETADARSAIESVRLDPPDLILQDLLLPDMDGVDLTHCIRQLPGGNEIPIIMLSGFAFRLFEERTISAKYSAWLLKPVDAFQLLEAVKTHLPSPLVNQVGKGVRLLIIDDDPVQLKLERFHFIQLGFQVITSPSFVRSLELLRTSPIDAILCDVLMPEMDGFDLCMEIRKNERFSKIPIILISSAYNQKQDRVLALKAGANDLLLRTPDFEGVDGAILKAIESGPPTHESEKRIQEIDEQHVRMLRRQLDQQTRLNIALARRCSVQAAQLCVLGGMADALSIDGDIPDMLQDVLAAALDAAAISRGILYLGTGDALVATCSIGYQSTLDDRVQTFFGHLPQLKAIIAAKLPWRLPRDMVPIHVGHEILAKAGMTSAFIVPLLEKGESIGALMLGSDKNDVTLAEPVAFARAIGAHIVKSLLLKTAFDRAAASEARYVGLVQNSGNGIISMQPDAIILDVNHTAQNLLDHPRQELIGHSMFEFIKTEDREYAAIRFKNRNAGGTTNIDLGLLRPDQQQVTINLTSAYIEGGSQLIILAIVTDVTERNRLRQQASLNDKLATVGTLAAGISHEINNPTAFLMANLEQLGKHLQGMRSAVERWSGLRRETDRQRQLALLDQMADVDLALDALLIESDLIVRESLNGAERIRDIVRGMKGFARMEETEIVSMDVNQVIETALNLAAHEVRPRAKLAKELSANLPPFLGSRGKLQQVIINLVVNAAQAIAEGHSERNSITVRTSLDTDRLRIEIADTGAGIQKEHLTKIFDPFFTTKPTGTGTGLGLSICYEIIRHHGGEILVDSVVGSGTTFTILLPIHSVLRLPEPTTVSHAPVRTQSRLHILIVDDEEFLLNAFKRMLKGAHEVVTALGGRAGISALDASPKRFDVILSDITMPDITGMDLYQHAAKLSPGLESRIIFMTGGAYTDRAVEFLDGLQNPQLKKPFKKMDLDHAIGVVMGTDTFSI